MPVDLEARVLANTRLSPDYNVITLDAPEIAALTAPGQFVMVKPGRRHDPLLRRPFSVFEVLRGTHADVGSFGPADGTGPAEAGHYGTGPAEAGRYETKGDVTGLTLLSKRIGVTTSLLFDAVEGDVISCLGPLGRPFDVVEPPMEGWIVAGGVGLAAFATLADALRARGTAVTLFYGARTGPELFYLDWFRARGVRLVLTTEDGSLGERGRITAPLERELRDRAGAEVMIYACGPEPMLEAVSHIAQRFQTASQVSLERVMGCGMGGCYSCVVPVRGRAGGQHYVRSCLSGPVFAGGEVVWE
jgi:dihydroorotate dehydrogenase electron transfer subunit